MAYVYQKPGQRGPGHKWRVGLRDHRKIQRTFPGYKDKRLTETMARHLQSLVDNLEMKREPPKGVQMWLTDAPPVIKAKLVKYHMIEPQRLVADRSLLDHLQDMDDELADQDVDVTQRSLYRCRIRAIIEGCNFSRWQDIQEAAVLRYLKGLRSGEINRIDPRTRKTASPLAKRTSNFYLQAFKMFCKWMVHKKRAQYSPVAHTSGLRITEEDVRHPRTHFTVEQIRKLIDETQSGPVRHGLSGPERALLYRFAVETGLRAKEIRRLRVRSIEMPDIGMSVVRLKGGQTKNKDGAVLPLTDPMAVELHKHIGGRDGEDRLFHGDASDGSMTKQTAKMLKKDLAAAEIPYVDDGLFHDFHAFRHTTNQWLQELKVPARIIQWILRHKVMKMQDVYTRENLELMASEIRKASAYGRQKQEPARGEDTCAA
jgi:integrase